MKKLMICLGIFIFAVILGPLGFFLLSRNGAWEGIGFLFAMNLFIYPVAFAGIVIYGEKP